MGTYYACLIYDYFPDMAKARNNRISLLISHEILHKIQRECKIFHVIRDHDDFTVTSF
jgi:hypothetical protein